jgi:hypothetical protein
MGLDCRTGGDTSCSFPLLPVSLTSLSYQSLLPVSLTSQSKSQGHSLTKLRCDRTRPIFRAFLILNVEVKRNFAPVAAVPSPRTALKQQ